MGLDNSFDKGQPADPALAEQPCVLPLSKDKQKPYLFSPPRSPKDSSWLYSNAHNVKLKTDKTAGQRENGGGQ